MNEIESFAQFEAILSTTFGDTTLTELLHKMSLVAIPCRTCDELLRVWNLPTAGLQRRVSRRRSLRRK